MCVTSIVHVDQFMFYQLIISNQIGKYPPVMDKHKYVSKYTKFNYLINNISWKHEHAYLQYTMSL